MTQKILFTLDGSEVEADPDETIWQVAKRLGTTIPHLCWRDAPGYRADGNCRACMVEVEGERVLAASCIRKPAPGMKVSTATERAKAARHMVFELLMADQPPAEDARMTVVRRSSPGPRQWMSACRASPGTTARVRICRIRPWRSISMPASIAICAFVPAAKCR